MIVEKKKHFEWRPGVCFGEVTLSPHRLKTETLGEQINCFKKAAARQRLYLHFLGSRPAEGLRLVAGWLPGQDV